MLLQQDFSFKSLENTARLLVPHIVLLCFLLLNVTALPLLPADIAKPQFVLMAVYYWAIYRPTLLPPVFCFILGLAMDALTGMTLGINALVFVLTFWIVRDQRRFLMGQPYSTIWAVFCLVAMLSVLSQWGLSGIAQNMQWTDIKPVATGALTSMLLFPFITLALVLAHRILPVASRAYP